MVMGFTTTTTTPQSSSLPITMTTTTNAGCGSAEGHPLLLVPPPQQQLFGRKLLVRQSHKMVLGIGLVAFSLIAFMTIFQSSSNSTIIDAWKPQLTMEAAALSSTTTTTTTITAAATDAAAAVTTPTTPTSLEEEVETITSLDNDNGEVEEEQAPQEQEEEEMVMVPSTTTNNNTPPPTTVKEDNNKSARPFEKATSTTKKKTNNSFNQTGVNTTAYQEQQPSPASSSNKSPNLADETTTASVVNNETNPVIVSSSLSSSNNGTTTTENNITAPSFDDNNIATVNTTSKTLRIRQSNKGKSNSTTNKNTTNSTTTKSSSTGPEGLADETSNVSDTAVHGDPSTSTTTSENHQQSDQQAQGAEPFITTNNTNPAAVVVVSSLSNSSTTGIAAASSSSIPSNNTTIKQQYNNSTTLRGNHTTNNDDSNNNTLITTTKSSSSSNNNSNTTNSNTTNTSKGLDNSAGHAAAAEEEEKADLSALASATSNTTTKPQPVSLLSSSSSPSSTSSTSAGPTSQVADADDKVDDEALDAATAAKPNSNTTKLPPVPSPLPSLSSSSSSPEQQEQSRKMIGPNMKACYHAIVSGNNMDYILQNLLKFVPLKRNNQTTAEKKDPSSPPTDCFVRRPQQKKDATGNCSHPEEEAYDIRTDYDDWKVILDTPTVAWTNSTIQRGHTVCDLTSFVQQDMGGPKGFAYSLLLKIWKQQQEQQQGRKPIYNVVLMGDYNLQRIWETWVCNWSHDITNIASTQQDHLQVVVDGNGDGENTTSNSHSNSKSRTMGKLLTSKSKPTSYAPNQGCHPASTNTTFDSNNSTNYTNTNHSSSGSICASNNEDDNSAAATATMVEFGGMIRFYYIYHPYHQQYHLPNVTTALGLDLPTVDQLIFSREGIQKNHKVLEKLNFISWLPQGVWDNQIQWNSTDFWQHKNISTTMMEGGKDVSNSSLHNRQYDDDTNQVGGHGKDTDDNDDDYGKTIVDPQCGSIKPNTILSREERDEANFLLLMLLKHAVHVRSNSGSSSGILDVHRLPATHRKRKSSGEGTRD